MEEFAEGDLKACTLFWALTRTLDEDWPCRETAKTSQDCCDKSHPRRSCSACSPSRQSSPVGGTDGTHDALVSMDKGELNNAVYQDPVAQGEEAINAAYLMAKHEPNPKVADDNIWIPYQKITKENYKSFMK
jgi:hypothetical protein